MRREVWDSWLPARFTRQRHTFPDRAFIGPRWLAKLSIGPIPAILDTARNRYIAMNESLASGNISRLQDVCIKGLATSLTEQIDNRGRQNWSRWCLMNSKGELTTEPYLIKAKLVITRSVSNSDEGERAWAMQQVVVRFRSDQYREIMRDDRRVSETRQYVDEYIAFQRKIVDKEVQPWYIWGNVEPDTFETWQEREDVQKDLKSALASADSYK
jgi:hypothetical protein